MAKQGVLARLRRLRELEEEQSRLELEAKVRDRNRIAEGLEDARERARRSRRAFLAGLGGSDTAARQGSVVELEQARHCQDAILPWLEIAAAEVELKREDFLARRTGRKQVETLLEGELRARREEAVRRAQQMLDDWYGRSGLRGKSGRGKVNRNAGGSDGVNAPSTPSMNSP